MTRVGIAAIAALASIAISGGATAQRFENCKGPFAECVKEVGGSCESDGKGGQTITFWDRASSTHTWEECVGKVLEKNGRRNPYKTTPSPKPDAKR